MRRLDLKKDKRGIIGIILFFSILAGILVIGFAAAIIIGVISFAGDVITPVITDLGVVGETNLTEVAQVTIVPANNFIQALPWLIGMVYVLALVGSIMFAATYSFNQNPIYIGFYFMLIVLLIFGAIMMSNAYESIYEGTDTVATKLQEQTLMSYMLLYSPFILALIAFITGIYLFVPREQGGFGGV